MNFFEFKNNQLLNADNNFLAINFKASSIQINMERSTLKIDEFIGKVLSYLAFFGLIVVYISSFINEFESKNKNIFKIFKAYHSNDTMMKKIRIIQENFNEVEYQQNPDFNEIKPSIFIC